VLLTGYVRPTIREPVLLDPDGRPVRYGGRWPDGPPDAAYGVDSHPGRFAPLHDVADALVRHLAARHDVAVTDDLACADDLRHPVAGAVRAVRLVPRRETAAPLTVVWTGYPAVALHAGLLHDFPFPVCGCDACDDSVPELLDLLEATVLTIAEGGLSEWRSGPGNAMPMMTDDAGNPGGAAVVPWQVHTRLDGRIESEGGGWSSNEPEPVELPEVPYRWERWPLKLA